MRKTYQKLLSVMLALLMLTGTTAHTLNLSSQSAIEIRNISVIGAEELTFDQTPDQNIIIETAPTENDAYLSALGKAANEKLTAQETNIVAQQLSLSENEVTQLHQNGNSIDQMQTLSQIAAQGFTLQQAQDILDRYENRVQAYADAGMLSSLLAQQDISQQEADEIRTLFAEGAPLSNLFLKRTYAQRLALPLSALYAVPSGLPLDFGSIDPQQLLTVAEVSDIGVEILLEYCQDNHLTVQQLSDRLFGREETLTNNNTVQPANQSTVQSTTNTTTISGTGSYSPSIDFSAQSPYHYSDGVAENLNLPGGDLTYAEDDFSLPGRNGLDLHIGTNYSTRNANLNDVTFEFDAVYRVDTTQTTTFTTATVYWESYRLRYGTEKLDFQSGTETFTDSSAYDSFMAANNYISDEIIDYDPEVGGIADWQYVGVATCTSGGWTTQTSTSYVFDHYDFQGNDTVDQTYFEKHHELGAGWNFAFDWIGTSGNTQYLHFGSGEAYQLVQYSPESLPTGSTKGYTLKDYQLEDKKLYDHNGSWNNGTTASTGTSAYMLVFADGKTEYFNSNGQLIGIVDRFGNSIKFEYSGTKHTPSRVTTSDGKVIVFTWSNPSSDKKILTLTMDSVVIQSYELTLIPGTASDWQLSAKTDRAGNTTSYSYTKSSASANFFSDSIAATSLYFHLLSGVSHPNDAAVGYGYTLFSKKLSNSNFPETANGTQQYYRITSRINGDGGKATTVSYSSIDTNTGIASSAAVTDARGNQVVTIYTDLLPTVQEAYYNGELKKRVQTTYTTTKLPNEVITRTYEGSAYVETKEKYVYDAQKRGLVTAYWGPRANGNFSSDNPQIVLYTYDSTYASLLTTTYYTDANTKIVQTNTLSTDKRNIIRSETAVNNVLKNKTEYEYDSYGNVTKQKSYPDVTLTATIDTVFSYQNGVYTNTVSVSGVKDSDGALIAASQNNAAGVVSENFTYDTWGNVTSVTNAEGNVTQYAYDAQNRPVTQTNPDASTHSFSYNTAKNHTIETDERGTKIKYQYDAYGNLLYTTDADTGALLSRNYYDKEYRLLYTHNAKDFGYSCTSYEYDALGRCVSQTVSGSNGDVLSRTAYRYIDAFQWGEEWVSIRITEVETGEEPIVTHEVFNKYGDLIAAKNILNGKYYDTFVYDWAGRKISQKTAQASADYPDTAYTSKWDYDHLGNVIREYNALGQYVSASYDAIGRKLTATDYAGSVTEFTYDNLGRLTVQKTPFVSIEGTIYHAETRTDYNRTGNVIRTRTKNNQPGSTDSWTLTENTYNNRGFLTETASYTDTTTALRVGHTYDTGGNPLTQSVGLQTSAPHTVTTAYNRYSLPITVTDAMGNSETAKYSLNGLQNSATDRNGTIITNQYNGLGAVIETLLSSGENAQLQSTTYRMGLVRQISEGSESISYEYDGYGRVIRETSAGTIASVKEYTYDLAGRLITSTVTVNNSTKTTRNEYDRLGRIVKVYEDDTLVVQYTYDANGNRASMTYANGNTTTYSYNLANLVVSVTNTQGSTTLSAFSYEYLLDGNQSFKHETGTVNRDTAYTYDRAGRLTSETVTGTGAFSAAYTYDGYGNRATMTNGDTVTAYVYDANNRLTTRTETVGSTATVTAYTYDANGNQLTEQTGDVVHTSTYDLFGRQTGFDQVAYGYNALGQRVSKTADGTTTRFVWDGDYIVWEQVGTTVSWYVYGVGRVKSNTAYYLYNAHGDVVQLSNNSGAVTKNYAYDAFGVEQNPDAADVNPWRYCGEYYDKETGNIYLRARYYDPVLGRFTQEDPIGDGLNWYTYCDNNPVVFIDPWGLFTEEQYDLFHTFFSKYIFMPYEFVDHMNNYENLHQPESDWFEEMWQEMLWQTSSNASKRDVIQFDLLSKNIITQSTTKTLSSVLYNQAKIESRITCDFDGYRSIVGRHEGLDFQYRKSKNDDIYSVINGEVVANTKSEKTGLTTLAIFDHIANKTVIYLHADFRKNLNVGNIVFVGQWLGKESNNGNKVPIHTHIEVRDGLKSNAAKSVGDETLDNKNPYDYWTKKGYLVK